MSAIALSLASETTFSSVAKQEEGNNSISIINDRAILVKPKISNPHDTTAKTSTLSENSSSTMAPRRKVESPRVCSTAALKPQEFKKIRKYDGIIIKRESVSFWARLAERPSQFPAIEAEFELSQLTASDRDLAVEGTPIVWTLGFGRIHGTWRRESIVYIRRLLPPSAEELKKSQAEAQEMMNAIVWE